MRVVHANKSSGLYQSFTAIFILDGNLSCQKSCTKIEISADIKYFKIVWVEPLFFIYPESYRQPIWNIHKIFVFDFTAGNL